MHSSINGNGDRNGVAGVFFANGNVTDDSIDARGDAYIDRRDLPIYFLRVEIRIIEGAKDFHDAVAHICYR